MSPSPNTVSWQLRLQQPELEKARPQSVYDQPLTLAKVTFKPWTAGTSTGSELSWTLGHKSFCIAPLLFPERPQGLACSPCILKAPSLGRSTGGNGDHRGFFPQACSSFPEMLNPHRPWCNFTSSPTLSPTLGWRPSLPPMQM